MKGLVVISHARLAEELLNATEMIIGPVARARAVCIRREESVDAMRREIEEACAEVGVDGDGILVLTDMFGGTPANLSIPLIEKYPLEVLTGVNLPMVLKFFSSRDVLPLAELGAMLRSYSREGILLASELVRRTGAGGGGA